MSTVEPHAAGPAADRLSPLVAAGMFVIALVVLVLQITLTRILSVSVSHHSAFIVIALVMLGMAAGAVAVFRLTLSERAALPQATVRSAFLAALAALFGLLIYAKIVCGNWGTWFQPLQIVLAAVVFLPAFYYSGYAVSGLLTHFARQVSLLYWFDLMGAAIGCAIVVPLLDAVAAPVLVVVASALFAAGGVMLAWRIGSTGQRRAGLGLTVALGLFAVLASQQPALVQLRYMKGIDTNRALWERWNSLATVTVFPEIPGVEEAVELDRRQSGDRGQSVEELKRQWQMGWGPSKQFKGSIPEQLWMVLDAGASTQIVARTEDEKRDLEFLRWDVTAAGYWLRPQGVDRALVIGGGGGRDMLTALVSGAREVDVIELNPEVARAVEHFAEFAGPVYSRDNVHLEIGEARAVLSRRDQRYDFIQMSMVDAFAATMSGALVLSEQFLYTREAFRLYVGRLTDDGILSVSRWCRPGFYAEPGMVVSLLVDAFRHQGIDDVGPHLIVLENTGYLAMSVITVLAKRSPWTPEELQAAADLCKRTHFILRWPMISGTTQPCELDFAALLAGQTSLPGMEEYDLRPPTDDRPFFFNYHLPIKSWLKAIESGDATRGSRLTVIMLGLLLFMLVAGYSVVIRPLRSLPARPEGSSPLAYGGPILYFAGIGVGFMLIELAMIQVFALFLGHPTYSITVVLFTLLLFSGLGSGLTSLASSPATARWPLLGILAGALAFLAVPALLAAAYGWSMPARTALAMALIAPLALCMGMIFPFGVRWLTATGRETLVPWMWGINGLLSVFASVLGMWLAMFLGFSALFPLACAAYALPLATLLRERSMPAVAESAQSS